MSGAAAGLPAGLAVAVSPAFLASCAAVVCSPGPDSLLILRLAGRTRRRPPVLAAATGMLLAGAGYAALAVTGCLALLTVHPGVYLAWRVAGAVLLLVIGLRALLEARGAAPAAPSPEAAVTPRHPLPRHPLPRHPLPRHLALGFLSTAGNPKVGLFLTVFLPQFLPPTRSAAAALPLLAAVYLTIGGLWLVLLTEVCLRVLGTRSGPGGAAFPARAARIANAVAGAVLVGLACSLAVR